MLYTRTNCGFRHIVKALEVINEVFEGVLGDTPCHNTISNWVKKCGLNVYESSGDMMRNANYAAIVDESMMIGEEKLLFTVGVPALHQERPLRSDDVQILDIAVAKSWNGEGIKRHLEIVAAKVGHPPDYVISDNASIMKKGISESKIKHQRDISHSLGMYLERAYKKEADFNGYIKLMSQAKAKYNMTKFAYLLPPTQRTIARFINLSSWVKWSSNMLSNYHSMNEEEKDVFSFIPANSSLIDELNEVVKCIEEIEYTCKQKGLSEKSIYECQRVMKMSLFKGNVRMIKLGEKINTFLKEEAKLLSEELPVHNNSSDIIESLFGKYKERKSPNKLYGVTSQVLFIPLYTRLLNPKTANDFNFKTVLEDMKMDQIKDWSNKNLTPNLMTKRTQFLQKAG